MVERILSRFSEIGGEIRGGNLYGVLTRFSDLLLVACVAVMVGLMIVPLPTFLLDILITINIAIAVTILMVSIYISSGAQLASFPTILLITTLYRLSLDISATRLILGKADAGEVIRSFGEFVVGGNFVVGAVIFLIITLVQFVVITKGGERVAEVAARFSLDAMPGKQMSIDADMRAGIIDFNEARARREALSRESQFYGAMDGAMKFVKGDAIAGIIITLINIIGGLVIGMGMNGMPLADAVQTYSILTIGNGLVSQIPALLISISAGMVVTRVASEDKESNLGKDVAVQILAKPKAIGVASAILFAMFLIPGLPKIPFLVLATATGAVSYGLLRSVKMAKEAELAAGAPPTATAAEGPVELTVAVPLVIEVSRELTPYIDVSTPAGQHFLQRLMEARNGLYYELGVVFPSIQISGNSAGEPGSYTIWVNEVPAAMGRIREGAALVNNSAREIVVYGLKAEDCQHPATGRPAAWIPAEQSQRAKDVGLRVWSPGEILVAHVVYFLRKNAREFLGLQEVQSMIDGLKQYYPALVGEVIPKPVSLHLLTDILQRLVEEEISIRDMKSILQALSESARTEHDPVVLAERVRAALKRKICYQLSEGKGTLYVYQLDPDIEEMFRNSIRQSASGAYLAMEPAAIQQVIDATHAQIGELPRTAQRPVILTDGDIRRFVKRVLGYHFPDLGVISYDQLTPHINVQPLNSISLLRPEQMQTQAQPT
jgi:type III secretion protein V